jgi:hypothetical protein
LFGPIVGKEAVQGMLLLAAWSANGWLPSGHAVRMALDLGLNRALEQLSEDSEYAKRRTEDEERNLGMIYLALRPSIYAEWYPLVVSARIWLCLYWFDHQFVDRKFLVPFRTDDDLQDEFGYRTSYHPP